MILYVSTRSSSLAAQLAFVLAGTPGEVREIDLRAGEGRTPEYLAINPKGQVPALVLDSGETLTETPAILLALGELVPESGLIPSDQLGRWRVMEWLSWCAWHVPRAFHPAFRPSHFGPAAAESSIRDAALTRVGEVLDYIEQQIAGRDYAVGDSLTAADLYIALITTFAGFVGVAPPDSLMAHRARIFSIPALADTLKAEGFAT
ncbi:MAG: glutathione transferase GstA [Rubritepida sp.]|nr:glutathione transferase GstA [Rubritepida sp.]